MPNKNMLPLAGKSLIARVGETVGKLAWIDRAIISTDSTEYAREAEAHGLAAPFMRPPHLSADTAGAIETLQHAVLVTEEIDKKKYDIVLILEPTSPLRTPLDIEQSVDLLISKDADSVVTVSRIDSKFHPMKLLSIEEGMLKFYSAQGGAVKARQQLAGNYCFRNGICYALTRDCLLAKEKVFTEKTFPLVIDRPVANIDDALDFAWAEFLLSRKPEKIPGS